MRFERRFKGRWFRGDNSWKGAGSDLSLRALSGRLKFTVRSHKFNEDFLFRVEVGDEG